MQLEKKITLNNNIYYIIVDLEYKKNKLMLPKLYIKNNISEYWDDGNCSLLIKNVEKEYTYDRAKEYDKNIAFMADVIYIYNKIPFISGIKNISNSNINPTSLTYISKEEIEKYIKEFNIKTDRNIELKLNDMNTWN